MQLDVQTYTWRTLFDYKVNISENVKFHPAMLFLPGTVIIGTRLYFIGGRKPNGKINNKLYSFDLSSGEVLKFNGKFELGLEGC